MANCSACRAVRRSTIAALTATPSIPSPLSSPGEATSVRFTPICSNILVVSSRYPICPTEPTIPVGVTTISTHPAKGQYAPLVAMSCAIMYTGLAAHSALTASTNSRAPGTVPPGQLTS